MPGSDPPSGTTEPVLVVSDSLLPTATPHDDTLLPCSPSQLLNTDVAAKTLQSMETHEKSVEEKVGFVEPCIYMNEINKSMVPNIYNDLSVQIWIYPFHMKLIVRVYSFSRAT